MVWKCSDGFSFLLFTPHLENRKGRPRQITARTQDDCPATRLQPHGAFQEGTPPWPCRYCPHHLDRPPNHPSISTFTYTCLCNIVISGEPAIQSLFCAKTSHPPLPRPHLNFIASTTRYVNANSALRPQPQALFISPQGANTASASSTHISILPGGSSLYFRRLTSHPPSWTTKPTSSTQSPS